MTTEARDWDAATCDRGVRQLFRLADELDRAYERLSTTESRLAGWSGSAADHARPRVRAATVRVSGLAGLLRQAADVVRSGLHCIAEAARLAGGAAQSPREADEGRALAAAVDGRISAGLDAVRTTSPAARLPGPDSTAAEVAHWWTALPPELRRQLLAREPATLGSLAGLPAEIRDAANRRQLATLLARLRAERDQLLTTGPLLPAHQARYAVVRSMLTIAEAVERALAGRRARLLTLDLSGVGRIAIGLGDVDRARHVAVLVPGMGDDAVHGVGGTVDRAGNLLAEAGRQSDESSAAIAWLGYAAPDWREVPFATRARAGGRMLAADLASFDSGRSVDGGGLPHVTLVGHSYGSTVVGATAQAGPKRADDLVLVGSPGVLAGNARELGLPGRRVYVGEAPFDPVADLGVFGADPGDAAFGATPIRTDPEPGRPWPVQLAGAHTGYFDPGSESLRNIARVVVGHGAGVTRPGEAA
jgi:pimeloyl-ACP methyl ester carboxylesterase